MADTTLMKEYVIERWKRGSMEWRDVIESKAQKFVPYGERWDWRLKGGEDQMDMRSLCTHLKPPKATSGSVALPQSGSALMSMAYVIIKIHPDISDLCCCLRPCWCLGAMLTLAAKLIWGACAANWGHGDILVLLPARAMPCSMVLLDQ